MDISRRSFFNVLPAATAGCAVCAGALECAAQASGTPPAAWSQKADVTWEQVFRFAYQKDLIPVLKSLAAQIGREKFAVMLEDSVCGIAAKGMSAKAIPNRDFATFRASMKMMPPLYRAALEFETVEDTSDALEYRVKHCLWSKSWRESDAADLGYAMVCSADFAIATAFNPKLKLARTRTLMQGHECCHFRYTMES